MTAARRGKNPGKPAGAAPPPTPAADLPDPNCTLGLTARHQRDLEAEVLYVLHLCPGPRTITGLFEGYQPSWAVEAMARCVSKGLAAAVRRVTVIDDGSQRAAYAVTCLGLVTLYETVFRTPQGRGFQIDPIF